MPKDNVNLPLAALSYLQDSGLNDREALFYCFIRNYQECGENLDTSKLDLAFVSRFADYQTLFGSLTAKGFYLRTAKAGIFKQARFFFENQRTGTYWRDRELSALDDGFYISTDNDLTISTDPNKGGPLKDFKAVWESHFFFKNQGDIGTNGKPQAAIKEWLARASTHTRNNSACEMVNGNGNSEIANEGISNSKENEKERIQEADQSEERWEEAVPEEWGMRHWNGREEELKTYVGALLEDGLRRLQTPKERQAKFEEIASSIPAEQHPERFRALFDGIWLKGQEAQAESLAPLDDETPW